ncbi:hypothetical protein CEXT_575831 [Caerostris extrusa]|uniref:Uncharacterized protein n=1 Tax=Caerostris extrusa TaxID=172846 RepID=A0AAV4XGQ3_CAEEX|nr:hypothetical protein CEXT_575831 [Caerostris extrusa]
MVYSRRGKRSKTVTVLKWTCDNIFTRGLKIGIFLRRLCRRNQPLTHKQIRRKGQRETIVGVPGLTDPHLQLCNS